MKRIKNEELSYYAGYFDGEGCIHARINYSKYFALEAQLTSTYPMVCRSMCKAFGGSVYSSTHGNSKTRHKYKNCRRFYRWRVFGPNAIPVLQRLLPFLREKKEQARLGIRLYKEKDRVRKSQIVAQIASLKRVQY
jgi:hypothetical protein